MRTQLRNSVIFAPRLWPHCKQNQNCRRSSSSSVLMPCLNEAETVATCIDKARGFLERNAIDGEVLIAEGRHDEAGPLLEENATTTARVAVGQ